MASSAVIRDASETLVNLLREGIPAWLLDPGQIIVASYSDFAQLPALGTTTLTVFLCRAEVRYELRETTIDKRLPLDLSYLITPWAMSAVDEQALLGRIMQTIHAGTVVPASLLAGDSWDEGDAVQFVIENRDWERELELWQAMKLPFRPSVGCLAQVFGMEGADPR